MSNAVERLEWKKAQMFESHFRYQKLRVEEEFDADDVRQEKKELLYDVFPIHGKSYSRLIERNGVPLKGRRLRNEQKKEAKARAERKRGNYELAEQEEERSVDHAVIDRLEFELTGIERLNQHDTYVLRFKSKRLDRKSKKIKDRFLSHLKGLIWVDRETFEVAQLQFQLTSEIKVWGGLLASIKSLKFELEQTEVEEDCWFPTVFEFEMSGRKLVSRVGYRSRTVSFDFARTNSEEHQIAE